MSVALLITTYQWPEALRAVLKSIELQSVKPDQIIVADDGSSAETRDSVLIMNSKFKLEYAWQPDRNFRAARSRNLGISRITTDYLIIIDWDCLLPPNFIQNHLNLAAKGKIVAGSRVLLDAQHTDQILNNPTNQAILGAFQSYKFKHLYCGSLRDFIRNNWTTVRTCNLGLHTEDAYLVHGFDENYVGWGLEDSDFVLRLQKQNIKIRNGRYCCAVAHLHHREAPREHLSTNRNKFLSVLRQTYFVKNSKSILEQI